ncbi:MAG: FkbM family methyltransferase [Planctomycetes bacterium]|nr:FkbM family methyltransferase [Planctomycetota bacterium]
MLTPPGILRLGRAAQSALAEGDEVGAERFASQLLRHDPASETGLDVLTEVYRSTGRAIQALELNRSALACHRAAQLQNTITFALHLLHCHGFRPRGILDIGAYAGEFSLLARQFWPGTSIVMVEPQPGQRYQLESVRDQLGGDIRVESTLLGDRERTECAFEVLRTPWGSTGSSLYSELSPHERDTVMLPMTTVDRLLTAVPDRCFDLWKIDVQGAELDVLRGGTANLPTVEVLFAEVALHECNRGAPRIAEVTAELDRLGFALWDLLPMGRDERGLQLQIDAVFVRKSSPLWHPGT